MFRSCAFIIDAFCCDLRVQKTKKGTEAARDADDYSTSLTTTNQSHCRISSTQTVTFRASETGSVCNGAEY